VQFSKRMMRQAMADEGLHEVHIRALNELLWRNLEALHDLWYEALCMPDFRVTPGARFAGNPAARACKRVDGVLRELALESRRARSEVLRLVRYLRHRTREAGKVRRFSDESRLYVVQTSYLARGWPGSRWVRTRRLADPARRRSHRGRSVSLRPGSQPDPPAVCVDVQPIAADEAAEAYVQLSGEADGFERRRGDGGDDRNAAARQLGDHPRRDA